MSAAEHAERQQLITCPPLFRRDKQHQSEYRDTGVDWNLRIRPCNLATSELERKE